MTGRTAEQNLSAPAPFSVDAPSDAAPPVILDDAEWAVLDAVERFPMDAGGVFDEAALVSQAQGCSSFGEARLLQATASLRDKGLFLALEDGRLQVTGPGRSALADRGTGR